MSRFNVAAEEVSRAENLAGGEAFQESPRLEFVSILLTSFVKDQYYRSAGEGIERVGQLIDALPDKRFAAKAAIYARNEYGMRSISHVVAAELAHRVKGEKWTRTFYESVVRRPDDMTEILSYYGGQYGFKPLPNSLKDGLARAFNKFDRYQLAKYRGESKAMSLIDVVNLVHPKPSEKNAEALRDLVNGKLRSEDTWEAKLTKAGQSEGDTDEQKEQAWRELIKERKIGYFALLRNLRNISEQAPELVPDACELLRDEKLIRKSLVLPFRYLTALEQIDDRNIVMAISDAIDISLGNVPELDGKTLVVIDHSASMGDFRPGSCQFIGDVFGAAMFKACDSDVMVFGTDAGYVRGLNPSDSTLGIAQHIGGVNYGHGTDFHSIFKAASKPYDRMAIFTDMQGWIGHNAPTSSLERYKSEQGCNPHVYNFDLAGYGTLQFPEKQVYCLAGFSEKVFDVMTMLETDRDALVSEVERVEL